jgi:hypothetical protein
VIGWSSAIIRNKLQASSIDRGRAEATTTRWQNEINNGRCYEICKRGGALF